MKKIAIFGLFLAMSGTAVFAADVCKDKAGNQSAQSSNLDDKQIATGNDASGSDHSSDPTILNGSAKTDDHA